MIYSDSKHDYNIQLQLEYSTLMVWGGEPATFKVIKSDTPKLDTLRTHGVLQPEPPLRNVYVPVRSTHTI
jgi:hypothetical protein